jgi:hypothetical protein
VIRDSGGRYKHDAALVGGGFDAALYLDMLRRLPRTAQWIAAPDVVGDWRGTAALFLQWAPRIRQLGFPVAYVLQDGCEELPECECVFVGGSTRYKLSRESAEWMAEARRRGMLVHVGRVNTLRRLRWAADHGADSVDGTQVSMFPDRWIPWTLEALEWLSAQTTMHKITGP